MTRFDKFVSSFRAGLHLFARVLQLVVLIRD